MRPHIERTGQPRHRTVLIGLACALLLSACEPTFNWREVHGSKEPYKVLLPAKPAQMSRQVKLDGQTVDMNMTAAETGDMTFAVGSTTVSEDQVLPTLQALQSSVRRNFVAAPGAQFKEDATYGTWIIHSLDEQGQPIELRLHFTTQQNHVYQLMAIGRSKSFSEEAAQTFLESFSPQ